MKAHFAQNSASLRLSSEEAPFFRGAAFKKKQRKEKNSEKGGGKCQEVKILPVLAVGRRARGFLDGRKLFLRFRSPQDD